MNRSLFFVSAYFLSCPISLVAASALFAFFPGVVSFIAILYYIYMDRLCGLVVSVSGYRYRGPGFDPRRYQIF